MGERHSPKEYELEKLVDLKRGLFMQRERYKDAKANSDFDTMAVCVESIKSDVKSLAVKRNLSSRILWVEKVLYWYETLEFRYVKDTPEGKATVFPVNLLVLKNRNLTKGYEELMFIQHELDLL